MKLLCSMKEGSRAIAEEQTGKEEVIIYQVAAGLFGKHAI